MNIDTYLGSQHLRAEMQPELMSGKLTDIDAAYDIVIGKERMLKEKGISPYGFDAHQMQGNSAKANAAIPARLAPMQGDANHGNKEHRDAAGNKICWKCNQVYAHPAAGCNNRKFHGDFLKRRGGKKGCKPSGKGKGGGNSNGNGGGSNASGGLPAVGGVQKPQGNNNRA